MYTVDPAAPEIWAVQGAFWPACVYRFLLHQTQDIRPECHPRMTLNRQVFG